MLTVVLPASANDTSSSASPAWIICEKSFCDDEKSIAAQHYNYTLICPYCHPLWSLINSLFEFWAVILMSTVSEEMWSDFKHLRMLESDYSTRRISSLLIR